MKQRPRVHRAIAIQPETKDSMRTLRALESGSPGAPVSRNESARTKTGATPVVSAITDDGGNRNFRSRQERATRKPVINLETEMILNGGFKRPVQSVAAS